IVKAVNLYGPTECSVDATAAEITGAAPHVGLPLPGVAVYVLDDALRPATQGEIFLAGAGIARGYLSQPGLTAQRFLPDVVAGSGRMYRTGDLARRRPDGALEFLGRLDGQIKLRGHRIEPAEIEAVLLTDPDIGAAAVVMRNDLPSTAAGLV